MSFDTHRAEKKKEGVPQVYVWCSEKKKEKERCSFIRDKQYEHSYAMGTDTKK
jgi:hypothetical protein